MLRRMLSASDDAADGGGFIAVSDGGKSYVS